MFPSHGAAAVPSHTLLKVDVGWDVAEDVKVDAVLRSEYGETEEIRCHREEEDTCWFVCPPADKLEPNAHYTFTAMMDGGTKASSSFSTAAPQGLGYEVGQHMVVEQLGANGSAAARLTDLFADSGPALLVTDGIHGPDDVPVQDSTWLWGPGRKLPGDGGDEYVVSRAVGYTTVLNVSVQEDGSFHGGANATYLPCELDGEWLFVRIDAVEVKGRMNLDEAGMPIRHFSLEGMVTNTSITRLVGNIDEDLQPLVYALFEADIDTDGDGEADAASLRMTTQGLPVIVQPPQ